MNPAERKFSMLCTLCPRNCNIDRSAQTGYCSMPEEAVIARAALHFGEEPIIGGELGSGAIFFSGCSLKCVYCQNFELSRGKIGKKTSPQRLAEIFRELEDQGAKNIDLVNPTHFQGAIMRALEIYRPKVPVVWNSSGYEKWENIRLMEGLVDIYLPDMKYMTGAVSGLYSGAPDYFAHASKALREMARQTGPTVIGEDGLMKKGMIVRHLVLPGQIEETKKVLVWIRRALPDAWLSLMAQYTPFGDAFKYPPLDRMLTEKEYEAAVDIASSLGFENGFFQETDSSGVTEIPLFDLTGV